MTWRERYAAAQARGYWTDEDVDVQTDLATCMAGEAMHNAGLPGYDVVFASATRALELAPVQPGDLPGELALAMLEPWRLGTAAHDVMTRSRFAVDGAGCYLDQIDDLVLSLKRWGQGGGTV